MGFNLKKDDVIDQIVMTRCMKELSSELFNYLGFSKVILWDVDKLKYLNRTALDIRPDYDTKAPKGKIRMYIDLNAENPKYNIDLDKSNYLDYDDEKDNPWANPESVRRFLWRKQFTRDSIAHFLENEIKDGKKKIPLLTIDCDFKYRKDDIQNNYGWLLEQVNACGYKAKIERQFILSELQYLRFPFPYCIILD